MAACWKTYNFWLILLLVVFHPLRWQMSKTESRQHTHTQIDKKRKNHIAKKTCIFRQEGKRQKDYCAWVHNKNWASFCGACLDLLYLWYFLWIWYGSAHIISSFVINTLCQFCWSAGSFRFRWRFLQWMFPSKYLSSFSKPTKKALYAQYLIV